MPLEIQPELLIVQKSGPHQWKSGRMARSLMRLDPVFLRPADAFYCLAVRCRPFRPKLGGPCDQLPKPSVTVKQVDARVTVNTQYGYKVLNHLGSALVRPGNHILGLTRGNTVAHFAEQARRSMSKDRVAGSAPAGNLP